LIWTAAVLGIVTCVAGAYAAFEVSAFESSIGRTYEIAEPAIVHSNDPRVIARGKHIAESIGGCTSKDCHGADLGGGRTIQMGPIGTITGPNITPGGVAAAYTDGQLARLIRHGIKRDGRSLRFMPAQDFAWLPDADLSALISYVRAVPRVDRPSGPLKVGILAKVLDRRGLVAIDIARRIDHSKLDQPKSSAASADYGAYLARSCRSCHGDHLSGGRIPGAPPSLPTPPNLTPHETGLKTWTYQDFERLLSTGIKKNGQKLNPFMPYASFGKLDATEKHALWQYLQSLPPRSFGGR
jgi:cytochrome c1